jgi:hypothetical protein
MKLAINRGIRSVMAIVGLAAAPCMAQDFNGDGFSDIAIGAPGELVGAIPSGAVTIIYGAGPGVGLDAFLPLPSMQYTQSTFGYDANEAGDLFGSALAWGDFDLDGFDDLAVGAPGEDSPGGVVDCGVVYIFMGSAAGLMPSGTPIIAQGGFLPDPIEAFDALGSALAAGDFNADGFADLAIGVPGEDLAAVDQGMVHQTVGFPGGLMPAPFPVILQGMLGDPEEVGDGFGRALACGEMDGVPGLDLAIGVPLENFAGDIDCGMVNTIYAAPGFGLFPAAPTAPEVWTQDSPGIGEVTNPGDQFGAALAIADFDVSVDGAEDLAIGVPGEDIGAVADCGAVNVIYSLAIMPGLGLDAFATIPSELWHQNSPAVQDVNEAGDAFGSALAACNFDGARGADLAIGVPLEDVGAFMDTGAVNVIYSAGLAFGLDAAAAPVLDEFWHQGTPGVGGANGVGDNAGFSLTVGDFDGTRCCDLAVGVPGDDFGAALDAGSVFTLYGNPPALGLDAFGPVPSEYWHQGVAGIPDANQVGDGFGRSLDNDD